MIEEIKARIEQISKGELPEGYARKRELIYPQEWGNPVTLNTVLWENKDRNEDGVYSKDDVLSVSGEYGVVNQIGLLGRSYAGVSVTNYHVVETGNIVYTKSPLKQNPYGIIKLNKGRPGIVSTLYAVYHCSNVITGNYLDFFFAVDVNLNNYLKPLVKKGAKNDMKVNNGDVLKGLVVLPSLTEQKKIVEILTTCDKLIALKKELIAEKEKLKKSCLSKMFPKNGNSVPEIRFPGFTDAWEQRKYSDVIDLASGQDFNPNEYNDKEKGIPYLTGASCIENGHTIAIRWTDNPRCIVERGDTVLVCKGSGYGSIATVDQKKAHIARQFMALKVKKVLLDTQFNYWLLNSIVKSIKTDARGLIVGIARDAVLQQDIAIPTIEEQAKIGEYFTHLDNHITLHRRELEETERYKKALMQLLLTGIVRVS